jgi:hypothetical protein
MSCPAPLIAATGSMPTRSSSCRSAVTKFAVAAIAARAAPLACGGTANTAPSPPKTNGNDSVPSALRTAPTTEAPAMLTAL